MRKEHKNLKKEIRPLQMIRSMVREEIQELQLIGLEKDEDGNQLINELKKCSIIIGEWINWIYDLK